MDVTRWCPDEIRQIAARLDDDTPTVDTPVDPTDDTTT